MSELRECPFCGSSAVLRFSAVTRIHCSNSFCGLESPNYANDDAEKLIRWWNTRPADAVREAAQLALTVLAEQSRRFSHARRNEAMRALRAALAQDGRG